MEQGLAHQMTYGDGGVNTIKHSYDCAMPNKKRKKACKPNNKRKKVAK
jgi:hypothetical protein